MDINERLPSCDATIVESPKTEDDCGKLSNATRVLNRNHFAYCVVTIEFSRRQIPIAFLQRINKDFTKKYVGGKATIAAAQSLNREWACIYGGVVDRGEKVELLIDKTENIRFQLSIV
ncbi:putative vesicle-associated membrane protein 726 [Glycine max]|nr:putative vesicle-associated membrane protein 726 [Glycine max]